MGLKACQSSHVTTPNYLSYKACEHSKLVPPRWKNLLLQRTQSRDPPTPPNLNPFQFQKVHLGHKQCDTTPQVAVGGGHSLMFLDIGTVNPSTKVVVTECCVCEAIPRHQPSLLAQLDTPGG